MRQVVFRGFFEETGKPAFFHVLFQKGGPDHHSGPVFTTEETDEVVP